MQQPGDLDASVSIDGCAAESNGDFCSRLAKNCDAVTEPDNCLQIRTVDCGTCAASLSCGGGGIANVCGSGGCASETDEAFCARLGATCNNVTRLDNCGEVRTTSCGTCPVDQHCGGKGPGHCGKGDCSADGWCWESPLARGTHFHDVFARSADDVWIVGEDGSILHRESEWYVVKSPTTERLNGVWAAGANDAWAVGDNGTVLRWEGAWSVVDPNISDLFDLEAISGTDSNHVWVVEALGHVLFWDGSAWSDRDLGVELLDLHARTDSDVWAVGLSAIQHFDGSGWSSVDHGTHWGFRSVCARGTDDVWIAADTSVFHWDGNEIAAVDTGFTFSHDDIFCIDNQIWVVGSGNTIIRSEDGTTWTQVDLIRPGEHLEGIHGVTANDLWMVGRWGSLRHFDGEITTVDTGRTTTLWDLWGESDSNLWGVGYEGTIVHFDGVGWETLPNGGNRQGTLGGVFTGNEERWVVGERYIGHWARGSWTNHHIDHYLTEVFGLGTNIWAVGCNSDASAGIVLHWDGDYANTSTTTLPDSCLTSVWADSVDDVWAVGNAVHHFDGNDWSALSAFVQNGEQLQGVWGSSSADVYIVGNMGTVLNWNGTTMEQELLGGGLSAVYGTGPDDIWIVGDGGAIYHLDSGAWSSRDSGFNRSLTSVWGSEQHLWVAGSDGTILHSFR